MALILLRGSRSQICPLLNEKTSDNKAHSRSFLTVDDLHLLHGKFWAGIFIILIGIKLYILPFSLLKPYCVVCKAWESKVPLPWHCQTNQAGPAGADRSRCNFTLHLCEATWTKLFPRWSHLTFESVRSAFEIEGFQFSHQLNCRWFLDSSGILQALVSDPQVLKNSAVPHLWTPQHNDPPAFHFWQEDLFFPLSGKAQDHLGRKGCNSCICRAKTAGLALPALWKCFKYCYITGCAACCLWFGRSLLLSHKHLLQLLGSAALGSDQSGSCGSWWSAQNASPAV